MSTLPLAIGYFFPPAEPGVVFDGQYGQRDKPLWPVPLFFCLDFESVFLVYGGAAFALLFMTYSSSSVHDEIM